MLLLIDTGYSVTMIGILSNSSGKSNISKLNLLGSAKLAFWFHESIRAVNNYYWKLINKLYILYLLYYFNLKETSFIVFHYPSIKNPSQPACMWPTSRACRATVTAARCEIILHILVKKDLKNEEKKQIMNKIENKIKDINKNIRNMVNYWKKINNKFYCLKF